ncbi:MAG: type IX secretion system protein PorQ [Dysgonamonadaceae bacterium]|jgi:hypothetical protein|nr:type IX secretion system protein PorQ [Dysgonamonadaceae bacterium]
MYRLLIIYFLFLISFSIAGQSGRTSFDYLLLPHSARSAALGGNNISAVETDISLVYDNPAFLGYEMDKVLHAGYMMYVSDISVGNVAFAKQLNDRGSIGIGVLYGNYGKMKETTEENEVIGDLTANDICANIFFAHDLTEKLRGGITGKFFYSNYHHNTAIGAGVDLGLSYYDEDRKLSFGLVGKNLGRQIKAYEEDLAGLPWDIQFGFSKRLDKAPIRFSVTAVHLKKWKFDNYNGVEDSFGKTLAKHLIIGAEILPTNNFWIALGYNGKRSSDMHLQEGNKLGGFSIGAGLWVKSFSFSCAVGKYNVSATSFLFSVSKSFTEPQL